MIPLYQSQSKELNWETLILSKTAHPGLVFDKFPNGWELEDNQLRLPEGDNGAKEKLYIDAAKRSQEHLKIGLEKAAERQKKLVETQSGVTLELQTDWRLITGLGNSHPYETGFIWHRTLGVPYLSGSSVKGILRDWITNWTDEGGAEANRLLGTNEIDEHDKKQPACVGSIIIFDALPVTPPKLEVDILNPHYQPYYSDPSSKPPADYYNPVPVKFLTVAPLQTFLFSFAPRKRTSNYAEDIKKYTDYLLEALSTLGAGGKTTVGYGVLIESTKVARERQDKLKMKEDREKKEKDAQELEKLSPLEQSIRKIVDASASPPHVALIKALVAEEWKDQDEQYAVAKHIKSIMKEKWKETTKAKKPEKDKDHQNTLVVLKYL